MSVFSVFYHFSSLWEPRLELSKLFFQTGPALAFRARQAPDLPETNFLEAALGNPASAGQSLDRGKLKLQSLRHD